MKTLVRSALLFAALPSLLATGVHAQTPDAAWQTDFAAFITTVRACAHDDCDPAAMVAGRTIAWSGTFTGIQRTTNLRTGRSTVLGNLAMSIPDSTVTGKDGTRYHLVCCQFVPTDSEAIIHLEPGTPLVVHVTFPSQMGMVFQKAFGPITIDRAVPILLKATVTTPGK
jgi:hypothetical protein